MKKNNKGFTLVELIVVLVILAILAAILVPALLGWIDKAREKSVTTNAEAALVAAQGLATEQYGGYKNPKTAVTSAAIKDLTDIEENFSIPTISFKSAYPTGTTVKPSQVNKDMYKITAFVYHSKDAKKTATWDKNTGSWTVTKDTTNP
ncbi:MAG: type II secretion system protein [Eubacterium sp.]|nr:type II secretion system protein [Eubacterium sp.]